MIGSYDIVQGEDYLEVYYNIDGDYPKKVGYVIVNAGIPMFQQLGFSWFTAEGMEGIVAALRKFNS